MDSIVTLTFVKEKRVEGNYAIITLPFKSFLLIFLYPITFLQGNNVASKNNWTANYTCIQKLKYLKCNIDDTKYPLILLLKNIVKNFRIFFFSSFRIIVVKINLNKNIYFFISLIKLYKINYMKFVIYKMWCKRNKIPNDVKINIQKSWLKEMRNEKFVNDGTIILPKHRDQASAILFRLINPKILRRRYRVWKFGCFVSETRFPRCYSDVNAEIYTLRSLHVFIFIRTL